MAAVHMAKVFYIFSLTPSKAMLADDQENCPETVRRANNSYPPSHSFYSFSHSFSQNVSNGTPSYPRIVSYFISDGGSSFRQIPTRQRHILLKQVSPYFSTSNIFIIENDAHLFSLSWKTKNNILSCVSWFALFIFHFVWCFFVLHFCLFDFLVCEE